MLPHKHNTANLRRWLTAGSACVALSCAACATLPGRPGIGAPREDAGADDEDLPPLPQPTTAQILSNAKADTMALMLKDSGAGPEVYAYLYLAANTFNGYLQQLCD